MARQTCEVKYERDGVQRDTPFVALTDDDYATVRVYQGAFHKCLGGRVFPTYVHPKLWEGSPNDLTTEVIEGLINPEQANVPKRVVKRTRTARA